MMQRFEALKAIHDVRTDEIVMPTMSAIKDWNRLSSNPLDFYVAEAMGYASSLGLGLALSRPDRKVLVLDGDGSLLMNLGTLVTIAGVWPGNLIHFVLENRLYEVPGGIPLPGIGKSDLTALARAAGLPAYEFDRLTDFRERLGAILSGDGPAFVSLKVDRGPSEPFAPIPYVEVARRFEKALKES